MSDARQTVEVVVEIAARPSTIFRYFTDPERFAAWMGAGSAIDATVGGELRVAYPQGAASGRVVEVEPDRRIVFTWGYDAGGPIPAGSTSVEVLLEPIESGTRVRLLHRNVPESMVAGQRAGWTAAAAGLAWFAAIDQHAPLRETLEAAWLAAWATSDDAARLDLLTTCVSDDVSFRDRYACLRGRAALSAHIGAALAFMPHVRLVAGAPADTSHGTMRMPWVIQGPDGTRMASGVNIARIDNHGRLSEIVAFTDALPA